MAVGNVLAVGGPDLAAALVALARPQQRDPGTNSHNTWTTVAPP